MEFGNVPLEELSTIDFTLPPDTELTNKVLNAAKSAGELKVFIGGTRAMNKGLIRTLYPKGLADNKYMETYARSFGTLEYGSTFYALLKNGEITKVVEQVKQSPDFRFCPKIFQAITHLRRFRNVEELSKQFWDSLDEFGSYLGPVLIQLGDNFTPKSYSELASYLHTLTPGKLKFLEARNKDWFRYEEEHKKLVEVLKATQTGAVITDTPGRRDVLHTDLPIPHAYIRFRGMNLHDTDYSRINSWVQRIGEWKSKGLQTLWFMIHQDDEGDVPILGKYLAEELNSKLGTNIKLPHLLNGE